MSLLLFMIGHVCVLASVGDELDLRFIALGLLLLVWALVREVRHDYTHWITAMCRRR